MNRKIKYIGILLGFTLLFSIFIPSKVLAASYQSIDLNTIDEIKDNQDKLDTVRNITISYESDLSLVDIISKCTNLEKLSIKKATIEDLTFINNIKPGKGFSLDLRMGYYTMDELSNPYVKNIVIDSSFVTNFSNGMDFENIERITVEHVSGYEDINYSKYNKLTSLYLRGEAISDFKSFFEQLNLLEELKSLGLEGSNIKDEHTKYLKELTNITSLDLDKCDISDISFLTNMQQLTYLIPPINVEDLSIIKELTNLKTIYWKGYEQLAINDDLIKYLDDNGIKHNKYDSTLKDTLINMVNEINIKEDMSIKEKVEAVIDYTTNYVVSHNNVYDETYTSNSLLYIVHFKTGVCSNYSYLEHALLKLIGVDASYIAGLIPVYMSELSGGYYKDENKYELAGHAWLMAKDEKDVWHSWDPVQIDIYMYTDLQNNIFWVDTASGKRYNFWKNPYEDDSNNYYFAKRRIVTNKTGYDDYLYQKNNSIENEPKGLQETIVSDITNQIYTSKAITPEIIIKDGDYILQNGTDYTVTYKNNVKVGTATVTITGKGNYIGAKTVTFKIANDISKVTVTGVVNKTYTGSNQTQKITVKYGKQILKSGTDYSVSYTNNKNKGTATVSITGKGNYIGTKKVTFKINKRSITSLAFSKVNNYTYTGKEVSPNVTVKYGKKALVKGTDYKLTYTKNVNKGTATVTVTGLGNYTGTKKITYKINARKISSAKIEGITNKTYTTKAQTQSLKLVYNGITLKNKTDYKVSYKNNTKKGTATVTITGIGNFTGILKKTFKINARSVTGLTYSEIKPQTYTGSAIKPVVTVKYGNTKLKKGTDYNISYKNNTKAGTATITITGKGNFSGTKTITFKINARSISSTTVSGVVNKTYTGSNQTQKITVKYGKVTLKSGTDYSVGYENNVNAGTATVIIKGKGNFSGTKKVTFKITARSISGLTFSKIANQGYTGDAIKPTVTVKSGSITLKSGTDYTVAFKNNIKIGTATVTITGKGNYTGSKNITFNIVKAAPKDVIINTKLHNALIPNPETIDTNVDNIITESEARNFRGNLILNGKNLDSIEGLEFFDKVTNVFLDNNSISDLTPLLGMDSLYYVGVGTNKINNTFLRNHNGVGVINDLKAKGVAVSTPNQIVDWDESKITSSSHKYKVLFVIVKDIDASVSLVNGNTSRLKHTLSNQDINIIKEYARLFERYVEKMTDYMIDLDLDIYITNEEFTNFATPGVNDDGSYSYSIFGADIPEIEGIIQNYDTSIVTAYLNEDMHNNSGLANFNGNTKRGEAFIPYDSIIYPYIVNNISLESLLDSLRKDRVNGAEVDSYIHEFTHTVEMYGLTRGYNIWEFHDALRCIESTGMDISTSDNYDITALYLTGFSNPKDNTQIGIPEELYINPPTKFFSSLDN